MTMQSTVTAHVSDAFDIAFGVGGVASPLWLQYLTEGAQVIAVIGGIILLTLRIAIAIRDLKRGHK